jgi:hypothetical protein
MKALLLGVVLGVLLLWPAALSFTAALVVSLAQPAVLAFALGVLVRPALTRHVRRGAS